MKIRKKFFRNTFRERKKDNSKSHLDLAFNKENKPPKPIQSF